MPTKIQTAGRIILGLVYAVFGGMGLAIVLGLMPMPNAPMSEAATKFMEGIQATGYFFPLLKVTEVVCGLMLLFGCAAPLALVVIAPVTLHIILFNLFLSSGAENFVLPLVMALAQCVAMSGYWKIYQPLFSKGK